MAFSLSYCEGGSSLPWRSQNIYLWLFLAKYPVSQENLIDVLVISEASSALLRLWKISPVVKSFTGFNFPRLKCQFKDSSFTHACCPEYFFEIGESFELEETFFLLWTVLVKITPLFLKDIIQYFSLSANFSFSHFSNIIHSQLSIPFLKSVSWKSVSQAFAPSKCSSFLTSNSRSVLPM